MITQNYNLNLIPGGVPVVVNASQYDKTSRTLQFTLYEGDALFTIPSGSTVTVVGTKSDNTGFSYVCSFNGSSVTFDVQEQMTVLSGCVPMEIRIVNGSQLLGSANFVLKVEKTALSDDTVISETELSSFETMLQQSQIYASNASLSAESANDSAETANNFAESADDSALVSEGYAVGTQNGTAVETSSPYYHNNARYYADVITSSKMDKVSSPTANDIVITDSNGQAIDSALALATLKEQMTIAVNKARRTKRNITSDLSNLSTAIAEQNLEKYGYTIGDYFVGASGYYYYLADMDTNYGGYNLNAVVNKHHCGIVVDTKSTTPWLTSGNATSYSASTLHSFLSGTALNNIKSDLTALFGDWSSHLIARNELDNAIGGWGTTWTGLADCYICAMSETQVYGSAIFSADGYQQGTCNKQLELFRKYRFNEIYGNTWIWLKSLYSVSFACFAHPSGNAFNYTLSTSYRASGLILFY